MNRSIAVLISAGATAFVMTIIGVGVGLIAMEAGAAGQPTSAEQAVITVAPSVDYSQREAQYKAQLAQANQRLQEANTQIAQANARIAQLQQPATTMAQANVPSDNPPTAANNSNDDEHDDEGDDDTPARNADAEGLSAEQVADIALRAARGATLIQLPALVDYRGQAVYQVLLDVGTLYIDPYNGSILAAIPNR